MCQLLAVCRKHWEGVSLDSCQISPVCVSSSSSSVRMGLQEVLISYNREVTELLRSKVSLGNQQNMNMSHMRQYFITVSALYYLIAHMTIKYFLYSSHSRDILIL